MARRYPGATTMIGCAEMPRAVRDGPWRLVTHRMLMGSTDSRAAGGLRRRPRGIATIWRRVSRLRLGGSGVTARGMAKRTITKPVDDLDGSRAEVSRELVSTAWCTPWS